ncbi:MAG: peptidase S58 family protein, partial [Curvibacter sp.]
INPVHTPLDGDTLFALATGASGRAADPLLLATLAAEATARAVVNAVHAARGLTLATQHWPACGELEETRP